MRKTLTALMLAALMLTACCMVMAAGSTTGGRVGVILYLLDAEEKPLADTTLLLQETLQSTDAYEGETDRQGIMMIPSFPLTGFVMAVRNADNQLAGLADVTLYPGSETRIMNNPRTEDDTVSLETLRASTLSEHINGNAPLEIAGGADSIPMYHYEVQISEAAGGVGALFKAGSANTLALEGVSDGAPGAVIPEPTLPPDDDAALPPASQAPSASATVSVPTPSPVETPSAPSSPAEPSEPSAAASTDAPQPTEPQEPQASETAAPSATETPVPSASESAAPTPTPVPTAPSPSASTTTASDLVNVKLFLKDSAGSPMAYYRTQLNGQVDATANGEGEAYYTNVTTNVTHELAIYTPEGQEVGTCGLRFVEGQSTSIASVSTGSTYTIDFQKGTQDVYVELVVDSGNVSPAEASTQPSQQTGSSGGTTSGDSGSSGGSSAAAQASEDVIGTPSVPDAVQAGGPSLTGYFSDEAGTAIAGATIRLRNEDTKALSSAITTAEGTFTISQLPPGNYSLGALSPQGRNLGEVQFTAARGTKTRLKTSSNGTTYLSEAQDSDTVFVDLRELSNGRLDLLYAAKSPMAAPAVPDRQEDVVEQAVQPPALVVEEVEDTVVAEPEQTGPSAGLIFLIAGLCAAGIVTAIVLVTRHARIR